MPTPVELLERRLAREVSARKQAESLLEEKSLALFQEAQEREHAVLALRASEERYRLLVELSPDAILVESGEQIVFANSATQKLFRANQPNELLGRSMLSLVAPDCRDHVIEAAQKLAHGGFCPTVEERAVRMDGSYVDVSVTRVSFIYKEKMAIQIILRDISDRKKLEAELHFQATHDTLTGLANRALLRDRLSQSLAYAARYEHPVWVVFIDLDRFKFINDSLGHKTGDVFLNAVSQRLQLALREIDSVGRLGGDEFVLILPGRTDGNLSTNTLQRIMDAVSHPLSVEGRDISLTCSIGVAVYPGDGTDPERLIEHADMAMYRAKELGRNNFQFFTHAMNEQLLERLAIESALRDAVARDEFVLHYQPQVNLHTGQIVGLEALVRWHHPELGMVPPARFIGLAEETGLIVAIGAWVIRTACAQNKAWQDAGQTHLRVAVNLSARQFAQKDLVQSIAAVLQETGLDPHYLDLELTESLVMADVERTINILRELKALKVQLSIDDFGTGYSSLSYLKRFPIDVLKIDQSFVRDITVDPDDAAIVNSIISLAHSLRLQVIAEGVESKSQLTYLQRRGCDEMQGFYFSRPLPADQLEQLLQQKLNLPADWSDNAMEQQTLLIVDDLARDLNLLSVQLKHEGYRILTAQSAADGFNQLALNHVQVILCDERMPAMSGTEFLTRVKDLYPYTVRIILTAHVDARSIIEAVNRGAIYRYFTKPCDGEFLREGIRDAFSHYWSMRCAFDTQKLTVDDK